MRLYFNCPTGVSSDMIVASLLDLGVDEGVAKRAAAIDGCEARISVHDCGGTRCKAFDVVTQEQHHHCHRRLSDIKDIVSRADITDEAKILALRTYDILAESESRVHGVAKADVHFHEVGSLRSVANVIAAAACLASLGVDKVFVPSISEGQGSVVCQHGVLPVPAPAVANIAATHSLPLRITDMRGEHVTPTGAALMAAIITDKQMPKHFAIEGEGRGTGSRKFDKPSILTVYKIK